MGTEALLCLLSRPARTIPPLFLNECLAGINIGLFASNDGPNIFGDFNHVLVDGWLFAVYDYNCDGIHPFLALGFSAEKSVGRRSAVARRSPSLGNADSKNFLGILEHIGIGWYFYYTHGCGIFEEEECSTTTQRTKEGR